jgi:hypothetical protein
MSGCKNVVQEYRTNKLLALSAEQSMNKCFGLSAIWKFSDRASKSALQATLRQYPPLTTNISRFSEPDLSVSKAKDFTVIFCGQDDH